MGNGRKGEGWANGPNPCKVYDRLASLEQNRIVILFN